MTLVTRKLILMSHQMPSSNLNENPLGVFEMSRSQNIGTDRQTDGRPENIKPPALASGGGIEIVLELSSNRGQTVAWTGNSKNINPPAPLRDGGIKISV